MSLITISQGIGSGGAAIAQVVAEHLQLEVYDDRMLEEEAVSLGIGSEELESLDERRPGLFDRIWSHKPEVYLDLMESIVYEVARKGAGIILGHCGQFLLREFDCALHVLIYAPESFRIDRLTDRHNISAEAAKKWIRKSDHEHQGFLRFAFRMEWNDLSLYDLVINMEKSDVHSSAKLIIEAAQRPQIGTCSMKALDRMGRLYLTKKIHAALLKTRFNLNFLEILVEEGGVVRIRGLMHQGEEPEILAKVAKGVAGVRDVQMDVTVLPLYPG
jgi:CMP/dCMP kinase